MKFCKKNVLAGLAGFTLEERGHDEIGVSLRFGKPDENFMKKRQKTRF